MAIKLFTINEGRGATSKKKRREIRRRSILLVCGSHGKSLFFSLLRGKKEGPPRRKKKATPHGKDFNFDRKGKEGHREGKGLGPLLRVEGKKGE